MESSGWCQIAIVYYWKISFNAKTIMIIKVGTHYASPLQLLKKLLGIRCQNKRAMSAVANSEGVVGSNDSFNAWADTSYGPICLTAQSQEDNTKTHVYQITVVII